MQILIVLRLFLNSDINWQFLCNSRLVTKKIETTKIVGQTGEPCAISGNLSTQLFTAILLHLRITFVNLALNFRMFESFQLRDNLEHRRQKCIISSFIYKSGLWNHEPQKTELSNKIIWYKILIYTFGWFWKYQNATWKIPKEDSQKKIR